MISKRVVVVDDNQVIKVVIYHDALGIAVEVTPQRALRLAAQLLDAGLRHLSNQRNPQGSPDLDTTNDQNNPATGIKLFP